MRNAHCCVMMASFLEDVQCETHILSYDGIIFEGCLMRNTDFVS